MQSMSLSMLKQNYHIRKVIVETAIYSIYLIPSNDEEQESDILLIEHPPAEEPSAMIWPNKNLRNCSKMEMVREISEFLNTRS
jgi:hypothetical protein